MNKSVKIGIITIVDYTNFGNRLQNYALYYILQKEYKVKAITLATHKEYAFCDKNYFAWLKEEIVKTLCLVSPQVAEHFFGNNITRWANFCRWNKFIPMKNYYGDINLPVKVNHKFDFFFAGSDQIWNYNFSFEKFYNYFLKFAEDKKKIAVAGSFGVDEIPEKWIQTYKDGLNSFAFISVREEAGQTIIKKLLGRDVPVLIDPVMMLSKEEWLKVAKRPRIDYTKPYILKYYLGDDLDTEKINIWAKKNGFEVYELLNKHIPELYSAGPGEFISLIYHSSLICSDSFHCIAFSIIFSKPFIVYERKGNNTGMISRLETLLKKFDFQNRWIHLLKEEDYLICNYESVENKLKMEQQKFKDYISEVFNRR